MQKRILFVSANRHKEPYPVYPLGLSYLKTYLEENLNGYEIQIADCNMETPEELKKRIALFKPHYVGISLRNVDGANSLEEGNFMKGYKEITDAIREATRVPLIIGGAGFSIFPELFMEELGADYGIAGEGEYALKRLINALDGGLPTEGIEGLIHPRNKACGTKSHTSYLDRLEVRFDDNLADYYWKYSGMLNIQTKRGCPYHCIYCSYPVIDGRKVRTLDPELIVDNMARLKRDKGIYYFFFTDSVFNIQNSYNAALAECMIKNRLDVKWGAYFTPGNINDEMISLYKASGLTHVEFGTESFSDPVLKSYGKNFNFGQVLDASEVCLKHNVYYAHFLILGGHGETRDTVRETFERSKQIRYSVFFPFIGMRIYPQTRLQKIAINEGLIGVDDPLVEPRYYISPDFDLEEAKMLAQQTGKAWLFPDDPKGDIVNRLRIQKNKKGPIWEYLRMP